MKIRKAKIADISEIHKFVNKFAKKEEMLPRALNDLYENIRDIFIYDDNGIKGVCALHILWEDLAEIRSLAVTEDLQRRGMGKALVNMCLKEARGWGIKRVFALTYNEEFFRKIGFKDIDKAKLPHKIWGDCLRCPKFPECDEHALIMEVGQ